MANLDLSQPYKAAEIIMTHCSQVKPDPLPCPSKAQTFSDLLKAAAETD
jgi:hypothetical protein